MAHMTIIIMNIFITRDKFIAVKRIILIIESCIFTAKRIKQFMQLFLRKPIKEGLDTSIHLIHMISLKDTEKISL